MKPRTVRLPAGEASAVAEALTDRLDRLLHAQAAQWTGGLSPVSLALAWADWGWHLALSPGRQLALAARARQLATDMWRPGAGHDEAPSGAVDDDPRFRDPAWAEWPWNLVRRGFRNSEAYWREAASVPGMTAHHAALTQFFARQWLGMAAPANWLPTNPVALNDAVASGGTHLLRGARHWLADVAGLPDVADQGPAPHFEVGRDVAVTPGQVVYRNHLVELIRYDAQTAKVHPEPVFIVPSWIMKYYILDLSPHNSLVRYLVRQGHTVYMLSWRNPGAEDRELTMDDYLRLGVFDALRAIGRLDDGRSRPVHAMGYCLGGTLLAIAAAALAGDASADGLPPLATLTLLAAQTDFSQPGELGLFIDESQLHFLDEVTRGPGYLTGRQMAGSFQFLHSRDLVWTRRMREVLLGEREQPNDLMAWNADTTRMPARMHREYLQTLYLENQLAIGSYRVDGRAVSLGDIRRPVFLVGTERDHVSPWPSVYQLHRLCDAEITFVLASGGHNAGIVSEPGHAGRSYRIALRPAQGPWSSSDEWQAAAARHEGSWWPAWQRWLAAHSSPLRRGRRLPAVSAVLGLGAAPGAYVRQCYTD